MRQGARRFTGLLKNEYGLGHGHATAMAQVSRNREAVDLRIEGAATTEPGGMGRLWLDGLATLPA